MYAFRTRVALPAFVCFTLMSVMSLTSHAREWNKTSIQTDGNSGISTSLEFDGGSAPRVSYHDQTNGLKYASWNGAFWDVEVADTNASSGYWSSLELDGSGRPHIAHQQLSSGALKYSAFNGASWTTQVVDSTGGAGWYCSLALDTNGNPHISHYARNAGELRYAQWTGSYWSNVVVEAIGSGAVPAGSSLAFDQSGKPHLSYPVVAGTGLKHAVRYGGVWSNEFVDAGVRVYSTSMAMDSQGFPRMAFQDADKDDLQYAQWNGVSWDVSVVDDSGRVGDYLSLSLDDVDRPSIAYHDNVNSNLMFASFWGGVWHLEIVDSSGSVGEHCSVALNGADNPGISYFDADNSDPVYAFNFSGLRDPKWDQRPDCMNGIDVNTYYDQGTGYGYVLDDFLCDGRPVTGVRWWGSYLGYETNFPGPIPPPENRPVSFWVDWWTDSAVGTVTNGSLTNSYSMPNYNIEQDQYPLAPYIEDYVDLTPGLILERYYTSIAHVVEGNTNWEHEFVYDLILTNEWNEKEGETYWLGIQAEMTGEPTQYPWGWLTTSLEEHWNDDAVEESMTNPFGWQELFYDYIYPWHPYGTNSVDMAFTLFSDVMGRRAKKWAQPPDMGTGENMKSFSKYGWEPGQGDWILRADDFVSDGRRITDIHWWGSYIDFKMDKESAEPPTNRVDKPVEFILSWHSDWPTNHDHSYSTPSNLLAEIRVPLEHCHEVYYGSVFQWWKTEPFVWEHEYQYYVDLMDPDLDEIIPDLGPWFESNGVVYWLNIQAVFTNDWYAGESEHNGWGWKTTPPEYQWNDRSVFATNFGPSGLDWQVGHYPTGMATHPLFDQPMDLAFELTTDEVGTNRWSTPIVITNFTMSGTSAFHAVSVGDHGSGVQVWQWSTNLSNWFDLNTNALPLPPPWPNSWTGGLSGVNPWYGRIIQR